MGGHAAQHQPRAAPGGRMMTPAEPTRAQIERAKSRSVFIATPIARRPTYQYTLSLATTVGYLTRLGIRWAAHAPVGNSDLAKARNELAAMFLASEAVTGLAATDMIFIDDDIGWSAGDIVRLLASDRYVIGGVGAKRRALHDTDINKWCYRPLPGLLN